MATDAEATLFPFTLPSIGQKKITAAFDAGQISSDGGVLLLAGADKRLGLIDTLAGLIPDHRDPALITHTMADIHAPAPSPLPAAIRMPTIWTSCVTTLPSSGPAVGCRRPATIWRLSRRCHAGRMHRTCAR
jgi:hypothetical protein